MTFWRRICEYLRAGLWTPTDNFQDRVVYRVRAGARTIVVHERLRLHFGRWGRWRWRRVRRWVVVE